MYNAGELGERNVGPKVASNYSMYPPLEQFIFAISTCWPKKSVGDVLVDVGAIWIEGLSDAWGSCIIVVVSCCEYTE